MSARKLHIVYSDAARADMNDILRYTGKEWGSDQRRRYRTQLRETVHRLASMPSLGRARDDVAPGIRSFPVGSHLMWYSTSGETLFVVRVLHSRQDASAMEWHALPGDPGEDA